MAKENTTKDTTTKKATSKLKKAGPKSKPEVEKVAKVKKEPGQPHPEHGKKYRTVAALVDQMKVYSLEEAVALVKKLATTKFLSSIELHARLSQEARGLVNFAHAAGKARRVAIANEEVIEQIAKGKIDFDVLLATPDQMPSLAKYARLLGPKGLMPNPKSGTVTTDPKATKEELETGRTEFRTDAGKNVHLVVGKVDQAEAEIIANINTVLSALTAYNVRSLSIAPTMGPGVKVELPNS